MAPTIRPFEWGDLDGTVTLWESCDLVRPWNDSRRDIERKLAHDPEHLLVLVDGGTVVGSAMVGYDGHRGWINYLAVHPDHRGRGCGRHLMDAAEAILRGMGCAKINLQVRTSNRRAVEFYRHLGFAEDAAVSLGKRLERDR